MVTVTVPTSEPPCPSLTVYVKLSVPFAFRLGSYVSDEPSPAITTAPLVPCVADWIVSESPSGSVSPASTLTVVAEASSATVSVSLSAIGSSLPVEMVIVKVCDGPVSSP